MKADDYKFMQLAGNCACIGYLGKDRIRGPIDNVVTNGADFLKLILEGDYYTAVIDWADRAIQLKRIPNFEGDSEIAYKFKHILICHNDPRDKKYQQELHKRCLAFKEFLEKVKTTDTYYFTINLNENDVNRITHELNHKQIKNMIEYLKKINLLDKVIFVSTKHTDPNSWWNFYSNDFTAYVKKYSLKHVIIENLDYTIDTYSQFIAKAGKEISKWN